MDTEDIAQDSLFFSRKMPRFLNLLSHPNNFISEQISILLANLTNSFDPALISDRCMKAMMQILNLSRDKPPTDISLLAVLISVLNLSTHESLCQGLHHLHVMTALQKILYKD